MALHNYTILYPPEFQRFPKLYGNRQWVVAGIGQ